MNNIEFTVDSEGVALIRLNVPDRTMNVLTPELQAELLASVERIAQDSTIKGGVITSGKMNCFLAGADLKDLVSAYGRLDAKAAYRMSAGVSSIFRRLETCGKPVAAAINGLALGGGLELALACHYRVLLDSRKAVVGLPEVKVGLLPGAGGTQRLPRLIGIPYALPLLLEGNHVEPRDALRLGIVNVLAEDDQNLLAKARSWVLANAEARQPWDTKGFRVPGGVGCLAEHAIASFQAGTSRTARSTNRNYPAPLAILSSVFEGTQLPIEAGLRVESKYFAKLLVDPVARNLMRTMFVNKGAAEKLARRPPEVPRTSVRRLGILGAGMMGSGIAYVSAAAGIHVTLLDASEALSRKGKDHAARLLEQDMAKGRRSADQAAEILRRIETTTSYAALADCDLVIEAVFEDRAVKREVLNSAEAAVPQAAILASNTSTLPITGLAESCARPGQFIGMHFFSPVERMPLVEIIIGRQTSRHTLAVALDLVAALRKTPIVVNDGPGFFTSRVFCSYIDEGMAMLAEGVAPTLIENAARMAGMPVGPLAVTDEVTIELQQRVAAQAEADGLPERFRRLHAQPVIREMMRLDRRGRRFGVGFYDYPAAGRKTLWPGLEHSFATMQHQPSAEEVMMRLVTAQALEAAHCVEEGVIQEPADADLGSILGVGFPSWTGGVLSFVETMGVKAFVERCQLLAATCGPRFAPSEWLLARTRENELFYAPRPQGEPI